MSERKPLPDPFNAGPFSVGSGRMAGIPASRLRAHDLEAPFHGIRRAVAAPPADTDDPLELAQRRYEALVRDCRSFLEREGRPVVFSHVTAARLYRIPLPWWIEQRAGLDVSAIVPEHAPQGAGVIGHRLSAGSITVRQWGGLLVPSAVDTWIQVAAIGGPNRFSVDDLIVAGDGIVRRKHALATVTELHAAVLRLHRRRGLMRLRMALPSIRSGTDSPTETRMRLIIVRGGLPEPVIGHAVYNTEGFFVGTPDLAYVAERIALDYEGDIHRVDSGTFRDDIERRELFQDAGWRHIRVTSYHLAHPYRLVDRVGYALALRRG